MKRLTINHHVAMDPALAHLGQAPCARLQLVAVPFLIRKFVARRLVSRRLPSIRDSQAVRARDLGLLAQVGIELCSGRLEQERCRVLPAGLECDLDRRETILVHQVHVGTALQQREDDRKGVLVAERLRSDHVQRSLTCEEKAKGTKENETSKLLALEQRKSRPSTHLRHASGLTLCIQCVRVISIRDTLVDSVEVVFSERSEELIRHDCGGTSNGDGGGERTKLSHHPSTQEGHG
jgi:hypothetical protein